MRCTLDNTRLAQAWQHDGGSLLVQKAGLAMATAVLILGLAVMFSTRGGEIGQSLVQVFTCQLGRFGGGGAGCGAPAATTPGGGGAPTAPQADSGGGGWLDGLQTALDVIGLIPVIGEPVDLVNGVIYAARGDWLNAGLSFTAMIPIGGQAATGSKLVLKYGDEAVAVVRNGDNAADAANTGRRFRCVGSGVPLLPVAAVVLGPLANADCTPDEVLRSFTGRTINHFTNADGVRGITGFDPDTLAVGDAVVIDRARFGVGSNNFMANAPGDIFITDLPSSTGPGQLNNIGVFGDRQNFVISMGEGEIFGQGTRIVWTNPDRGIGTIPGNTTIEGPIVIRRVR